MDELAKTCAAIFSALVSGANRVIHVLPTDYTTVKDLLERWVNEMDYCMQELSFRVHDSCDCGRRGATNIRPGRDRGNAAHSVTNTNQLGVKKIIVVVGR